MISAGTNVIIAGARRALRVIDESVEDNLFLSNNEKTGFSINTTISETCRPTADCDRYCYGHTGRIALDPSIRRQMQNHRRFEKLRGAPIAEVEAEADEVYKAVIKKQNFLRMFGVGDLTDGSGRFINVLAKRHPDLTIWVSTRKIEQARKLLRLSNLHIMVSMDESTKGEDFHAMYEFVMARAPMAFGAYVQQHVGEVIPSWVKTVFAEHGHGGRRAKWTADESDKRTCPATIVDGTDHEAACMNCRYCFNTGRREEGSP